jgi:hypothetical protein
MIGDDQWPEATWGKCGGLGPLYEGLESGGSEGVFLVVMEWTAAIAGDHVRFFR